MRLPSLFTNLIRYLRPASAYFLDRKLRPLSRNYGFNRGTPIDRYYIEKFIESESSRIKGVCLEIGDKRYATKYGDQRLSRCDVLDIHTSNRMANLHADLRDMTGVVRSQTYDCVILTQVLGMVDDYQAVIREIHRILRPGGSVLITCSSLAPAHSLRNSYWRFLETSLRFSLEKVFSKALVRVESYGNMLAGQAFWVGMSQEDLSENELEFNDPHYPLIVSAVASKEMSSV